MTSAAKSELQVGRLSPEDADRFASMFRPAWELDDAPFASGTKLSAADMDALAGGAGVNSEVTAHSAPRFPPARVDSKPPEASIVVAPDPAPAPARQAAPAVAPAVPQAQQRRSQRPAAPARAAAPPRNALDSGDFTPPKKSNTGIIVAVGIVGLLAVGGIIAKFALSSDAPKPNPVATQPTQTTEERHIPPPPTDLDTPPNPTTTAAATTATTTATATVDKPTPPPTATATQAAATATATATARPTATVTATARPTATAVTTARPAGTGTGKTTTGKGTGGIVRDTPF